jgi:hypothetical protein
MVSSRTLLKITLVIAAIIISSTLIATTPIEAKSQSVQWTYQGSSSTVAGYPALSPTGDLFVYSTEGANEILYAVSPQGKGLWNTNVALDSKPQFSPVDGSIYVLVTGLSNTQVNGTDVLALSSTGVAKWNVTVPGVTYGMRALPDGGVVIGTEPRFPGQNSLICLNADGTERWTKGSYNASSPNSLMYPVAILGNDVLAANISLSSPDRSVITEYTPDGAVFRSFQTAFVPQMSIFFAPDGTMRMVGYNLSQSTGGEYLYALNANGSFMWALSISGEYGDLAILWDGTTVFGEGNGATPLNLLVLAVDSQGKELWLSSNVKTIPVAFGNGVLLANSTGLMLADRNGGVIWKLEGSFDGQPVVNGKTIYASSGSILMAISDSAWQVSWQPAVLVLTILVAMLGVGVLSGISPKID